MSRWPAYSEYRPAESSWLRRIPASWTQAKLKRGYEVQLGKMLTPEPRTADDVLRPYLRSANVYWDGVSIADVNEMWFTPNELNQYRLGKGDLVVCEGGDVGRSTLWSEELPECYIQNAVHRVRGRSGHSNRFLYYWLYTLKYQRHIDLVCSKATIAHLTAEKLLDLPLVSPSLPEQRAIADFLDRETARIDALVARFERLIALLEERRAALISHAVTKGLDPDVPMKNSGIPWLGEIPAHWEAVPLKRAIRPKAGAIKTGPFGSQLLSAEMTGGEVKVYNQRSVIAQDLAGGDEYITRQKYEKLRSFTVEPDDVLVTTRGTIGRCLVVPDSAELGILHPCLMRIQPEPSQLEASFLIYLIQDSTLVKRQLFEQSNATTIDVIYSGTMREVMIPLPSVAEQRAIVDFLDREVNSLGKALLRSHTGIDHLREYRTALISATVTGKIDVRETAK